MNTNKDHYILKYIDHLIEINGYRSVEVEQENKWEKVSDDSNDKRMRPTGPVVGFRLVAGINCNTCSIVTRTFKSLESLSLFCKENTP